MTWRATTRSTAGSAAAATTATSLQSGEREIVGANGAEINFSDEYARYSVHDGLGGLPAGGATWKRRGFAQTLKPPPPPQGERQNGRG